jgi:endonuclease-3
MRKAEKAQEITRILGEHFPNPGVPLEHTSPYTLLIAVLLSAQCTDERVNTVTPALFALADTPKKMAQQRVKRIQDIIRPCGLSPQKSKAIRSLSQILVDEFQSQVPKDMEALERLPGVGHKTASVVMSQAFGIPAFPVDTHIHRLAWRWKLSTGKNVVQTERDLKRIFPEAIWNKLHIQIILFGRKFCPARGHSATECPICSKFGRRELF